MNSTKNLDSNILGKSRSIKEIWISSPITLVTKILFILDFAFLPVIVTSGYYTTDTRFMWFLIGLWFIAIITHFNMIRREKCPVKGVKKVKIEGMGL